MYGNLKVFCRPGPPSTPTPSTCAPFGEPILPRNGLLWVIRVVLIVVAAVHAVAAYTLWARADRARTTASTR